MPRRKHYRLALYYITLHGRDGPIFGQGDDYRMFMNTLDSVLNDTGYRLYAFCLLPCHAHLVVRISGIDLQDFCQRLILKFNQKVRRMERRSAGLLISPDSQPTLVDTDETCRGLIRQVHSLPYTIGKDPEEYSWSGHRAYLGKAPLFCVARRVGLHLFGENSTAGRECYRNSMPLKPKSIIRSAPEVPAPNADNPGGWASFDSIGALLEVISRCSRKEIEYIRFGGNDRLGVFLRALVAYHAIGLGMATLREIAGYLHRDPSTLYAAVKRYKLLYPSLFSTPGRLYGLLDVCAAGVNGRSAVPPSISQLREDDRRGPETDPPRV